jgi:hypothetical protein
LLSFFSAIFVVPFLVVFLFAIFGFVMVFVCAYCNMRRQRLTTTIVPTTAGTTVVTAQGTPLSAQPQQMQYGTSQVPYPTAQGPTVMAPYPYQQPSAQAPVMAPYPYQQPSAQAPTVMAPYPYQQQPFVPQQVPCVGVVPSAPANAELSSQAAPPPYDAASAYPPAAPQEKLTDF